MFKESDSLDSISDHKMGILIIESDLRDHLKDIGKTLKRKVVEYVTVAGIEFLIELKNDATKLVPKEWVSLQNKIIVDSTNLYRSRSVAQRRPPDFIRRSSSNSLPSVNRGRNFSQSSVISLMSIFSNVLPHTTTRFDGSPPPSPPSTVS